MADTPAERQRRYRAKKKKEGGGNASRCVTFDNRDAVLELLEALPRLIPSHDGPYTYQDRASDFIAVFNGNSTPEQGKRVLAQIHQICDPPPLMTDADKPGTLAFKSGMRRVMGELMVCFVVKQPLTIERGE